MTGARGPWILGERLILILGQELYMMRLEHFVVSNISILVTYNVSYKMSIMKKNEPGLYRDSLYVQLLYKSKYVQKWKFYIKINLKIRSVTCLIMCLKCIEQSTVKCRYILCEIQFVIIPNMFIKANVHIK